LSRLVLDGIEKRFGDERVLAGVSLELAPGEVVALLGPSGSGKTTLLRILAGFERADSGTVTLGGERVDRLPPERRGFGMVFQHYALFPHLNVGGNVAFGLETKRLDRPEIAARVAAALARVDLAGFERRRVGELSGGQQQRVALARALAPEPRVLLLDEPLSNLDPSLRERTRRELAARLREVGVTCVLVTHEQEEAFELGERVALLHRGRLAQVGTPRELYRAPASGFVAAFVGRGGFVEVTVESVGPEMIVHGPLVPGGRARAEAARDFAVGDRGRLFLRPEMLELASPDAADAVAGAVVAARFAGASSTVTVAIADGVELESIAGDDPPARGARVGVRLRAGARPRLYEPEER
jgi:ABC-type Fe3+/spermidine/putrescine transport system ATPase subunit